MSPSRSLGSTTAPQRIILSTDLVQALRSSRCWTRMLASWHSMQAVVAFCCMVPAGSCGLPDAEGVCFGRLSAAQTSAAAIATMLMMLRNMQPHSIHCIPQITAWIPGLLHGLQVAGGVGGPRHQNVVSGLGWRPGEVPQTPAILGLLCAHPGSVPGLPFIG